MDEDWEKHGFDTDPDVPPSRPKRRIPLLRVIPGGLLEPRRTEQDEGLDDGDPDPGMAPC